MQYCQLFNMILGLVLVVTLSCCLLSMTLCLVLTGISRLMTHRRSVELLEGFRCCTTPEVTRETSSLWHRRAHVGMDWELSERSISKSHRGRSLLWLVTCSLWSPPGDCTWSITFSHLHKWLTWLRHKQSSTFCGWLWYTKKYIIRKIS